MLHAELPLEPPAASPYDTASTVVTSQLAPEKWHEYPGEPTVTDAICDRLCHNAHRLALKGPSRRKKKSQPTND